MRVWWSSHVSITITWCGGNVTEMFKLISGQHFKVLLFFIPWWIDTSNYSSWDDSKYINRMMMMNMFCPVFRKYYMLSTFRQSFMSTSGYFPFVCVCVGVCACARACACVCLSVCPSLLNRSQDIGSYLTFIISLYLTSVILAWC
jgi:hypothetical protein